jgi:hypothetical protein
MSEPTPLADRKALLVARSSLYRLTLARDMQGLRESLRPRNLASSATSSGALRPLLFGALTLVAGRSRVGAVVGLATRALMLVKAAQAVIGMARRKGK